MKTLEKIHHNFYNAILEDQPADTHFISSPHPTQRLATYRQTIFQTLSNALALTFPGIWKLLGEDCANNLALQFCQHRLNLPSSGCLDDWGAEFPKFIHQSITLRELPYLKDYANYEWLKHLSFCAPFSSSITHSDLESISESALESLQCFFKPSVFTLSSQYPLDKIESLIENPDAEAINLNANQSQALITCQSNNVKTHWINPDLYLFINCLQQRLTLGESFQKTLENHPYFDLTQSLQFIIHNDLLSSLRGGVAS